FPRQHLHRRGGHGKTSSKIQSNQWRWCCPAAAPRVRNTGGRTACATNNVSIALTRVGSRWENTERTGGRVMKHLGIGTLVPVALIATVVAMSGIVWAHHGTAAFDTNQMVTVKGTVTDFIYLNPHVQVHFQSKNDKGETEAWQGELTAPNKLNRAGWTKN